MKPQEANDMALEHSAAGTTNGNGSGERRYDAVIVGAGFGGLYMLHHLREFGFSAHVIEAAAGVGGTWYWNRYPGARCDVESLNYSYSFSKDLEQEWTWSEKYSPQPEILAYANNVADRFDLRKDIEFETRVEKAVWDDATSHWAITTSKGETIRAQYYIMASGCLSHSKLPEIPGVESFAGPTYHTGHWPHEGVDFTGLRVGVIGTGSSAIQSIPMIAEQAQQLTVFQRTPNFSMPAGNRPLAAKEVADMKARYPEQREGNRMSGFGVLAELPTHSALEVSEEERNAKYQSGWDQGSLVAILLAFNDTMTGALVAVDIGGGDGATLKDRWVNGTRTYLALCVAGSPNFFTITGPASPSVFSNMMISIEQHVDWIGACMKYLRDNGFGV